MKALEVEPDFTDALAALGYADLLADAHLDEARASVARAVALAPGRLDYALRLAEICARQRDYREARRLLTMLVARSDEHGTAEHARALLNRLDRAASETTAAGMSGATRVRFSFRRTGDGEHRAYGQLEQIECGQNEFSRY